VIAVIFREDARFKAREFSFPNGMHGGVERVSQRAPRRR
jgi:hypothetical protein